MIPGLSGALNAQSMLEPMTPRKYIPKVGVFTRHIQWLRKENHKYPYFIKMLSICEAGLLSATVIGIPLVLKGVSIHKHLDQEAQFYQWAATLKPPAINSVPHKTDTETYNHISYYVIHQDAIWHKSRWNEKAEWQPMFFDGFPERTPKKLRDDGANFFVIDDIGEGHYKKVVKEERKDGQYIYCDKSAKNSGWKKKRFTLPFLKYLLPNNKRLRFDNDAIIVCSHRGLFNNGYQDAAGNTHHDPSVTNFLEFKPKSKEIKLHDPWSPPFVDITIPLPETSKSSFEVINMDGSCSTVIAVGYLVEPNPNESGVKKTLQVNTIFSDIDTTMNPVYNYGYLNQSPNPKQRKLPMPGWQTHALPDGVRITKKVEIAQSGQGNHSRQLCIEGCDAEGHRGYFYKLRIDNPTWHFLRDDHAIEENAYLKNNITDDKAIFDTTVHDFNEKSTEKAPLNRKKTFLSNFGKNSLDATLHIEEAKLHLYTRKCRLLNFLGLKTPQYDLVAPSEPIHDETTNLRMQQIFKGKKVIQVKINESSNTVHISAKGFSFTFVR